MLRMVARARRRARTMPLRSPLTRVNPALSIATSAPVPMAMPTSACASAGASLTPSPAIATLRPSACSSLIMRALSSGSTSARISSIPSRPATARAVRSLSPVAMTTRNPCWCSALSASGVVSLTGSATDTRPTMSDSTTTNITVSPASRRLLAVSDSLPPSSPRSATSLVLPSATALPSTMPFTPLPVMASNASALARATPRSSAPATIASASGCSEPRSRLAARRSTSASSWPDSGRTATSFGLPTVSVPVLSTISVSTPANRSRASAFLISTPACAPRPVAVMIDIGVASPSAQGQAMIRTATAETRA